MAGIEPGMRVIDLKTNAQLADSGAVAIDSFVHRGQATVVVLVELEEGLGGQRPAEAPGGTSGVADSTSASVCGAVLAIYGFEIAAHAKVNVIGKALAVPGTVGFRTPFIVTLQTTLSPGLAGLFRNHAWYG